MDSRMSGSISTIEGETYQENYTHKAIMRLAQLNHSTSLSEEEQFNQLQKLHPIRNSTSCLPSLPESATDICVDINTVQKLIIQQANGSAPGISGMTGDMVLCLINDPV